MTDLVRYTIEGSIATIAMDDGKVNALSPAMFAELSAAFKRAEDDNAAVVLTGRDGVFSGGFDLKVMRAGGAEAVEMMVGGFRFAANLLGFPKPVVVACNGHVLAMGAFLALAGDYNLGARGDYKVVANEVAIGLTMPWFGVEMCRRRLNRSYYERAVASAEVFTPDGAVAAGFLDRVVEPGELAAAARAEAERLCALDQTAFTATKLRLREPAMAELHAAIDKDEAMLRSLLG